MEKFLALAPQRQQAILEAAMGVFGKTGYKKAFVSEIAQAAGISKAMVFYYFGSKRELYLYLTETAYSKVTAAFAQSAAPGQEDFFDCILEATRTKLTFLAQHPSLFAFVLSSYFEDDPEVSDALAAYRAKSDAFRETLVMPRFDPQKFKDGVDPQLVYRLLVQYAKGFGSAAPPAAPYHWDAVMEEFVQIVQMLKHNLYKEAYL